MTQWNMKRLCESIFEAEDRFDLLSLTFDGIKIWQASRMNLYYRLAEQTGVLETPQRAPQRTNLRQKMKRLLNGAKSSVFFSPLSMPEPLDAVIIEGSRLKEIRGRKIDIYTDALQQRLRQKGARFILLDPSLNGEHPKSPNSHRRHLDYLELTEKILAPLYRPHPTEREIDRADRVSRHLTEVFGAGLDRRRFFNDALGKFVVKYHLFKELFGLNPPKVLYIVCGYSGMAPVISAAKEQGVVVREIQHGTLSKYHLGYSFPNLKEKDTLDYFPDEILVWNEFWKNKIDWPVSDDKVISFGFLHLESERHKYRHLQRHRNQIVVLSQGAIGRRLADVIAAHATALENHRIIYKLHPGEYERWREYESLVRLSEMKNVTVETDCDLYELFAQSEIQIGVFSTAIYEGIAFGLKTVLVDLPGLEYMTDLIDSKEAVLLDTFLSDVQRRSKTNPP